jgi:peptidyl-prolyl cis-trans isomerase SurA
MPTSLPFVLASALVVSLAAPPPSSALGTPPGAPGASADGQNSLRDRVLAIVDEDLILDSDVQRIIALGLAQPNPGEADREFRRRVLAQLIDQRLRFHEIDRFGFEQVPAALVDQHVQEIRDRFKSADELARRLKEVGLTPAGLRQLVSRQLMVLTYVDERLGPKVFVTLEDINAYYRDVLTPELEKQGKPVPMPDEVREQIREVLKQKLLNKEIDTWTEELRRKADLLNYFDDQGKPLPPVVRTIVKKKPGSKGYG